MAETDRLATWTSAATDYVLEHGLIGLSLRPLAAALGTSDRMLLYHFGTKDALVAAILRHSTERSSAHIAAIAPSQGLRAAVLDLWAVTRGDLVGQCSRLYVEAAALGLLGREPYASVVGESNDQWTAALIGHLVRSGVTRAQARRAVHIIDAAFMGFQLDLPLDRADRPGPAPRTRQRIVADLADAVVALCT